jgi:hypothetical protein
MHSAGERFHGSGLINVVSGQLAGRINLRDAREIGSASSVIREKVRLLQKRLRLCPEKGALPKAKAALAGSAREAPRTRHPKRRVR